MLFIFNRISPSYLFTKKLFHPKSTRCYRLLANSQIKTTGTSISPNTCVSSVARSGRSLFPYHIWRKFLLTETITSTLSAFPLVVSQYSQWFVINLHQYSGMPWWLTFSISTILVRLSLFPLVRWQVIMVSKLMSAFPNITLLSQMLKQQILLKVQNQEKQEIFKLFIVYLKGIKSCLYINNVSLTLLVMYPIANIFFLVSFILTLRAMIEDPTLSDQLMIGGIGSFMDLTDKDEKFILPILSSVCSYAAIAYSFYGVKTRFGLFFQDLLQTILLIFLPVYVQFPAGVFCYLIPSSIFSILQTKILRTPYFQKLLHLPLKLPIKK